MKPFIVETPTTFWVLTWMLLISGAWTLLARRFDVCTVLASMDEVKSCAKVETVLRAGFTSCEILRPLIVDTVKSPALTVLARNDDVVRVLKVLTWLLCPGVERN